ncbi:SGNH/GDSL hydrolase family protein [Mucilaginibacter ginsenosidivorax]|uniref:G-D-S-L family lipolytic protein n=1 Tax=Mucilaginibacter ginsenosidivorax TaxID=862126 RepID=A0A5B8VVD3_9SPHI|nr:SGNH/GDSL hydrolase family protein [Mucilaginibacter ginsenosidivorax]QEC75101.1 G-D-S-L family lipolytic protein [Mucilaginibacter ginsenosidivorax]
MKKFLLFAGIIMLCSFQTKKPTKVVFFGDSITEYAVQPNGFITLIQQRLKAEKKEQDYEVAGAGIGGNKIYDLYLRYEDDVLTKNPDVVVIWVGVNDVWHKRMFGTGTDWDKFGRFYTALIKKLQAKNIKVLICTPASVGEKTDYSNELDGDLNRYSNIIRDLAKQNNCDLFDFRTLFHDYNVKNNPTNKGEGILTKDGVHLNDEGNKFVADLFYKTLFK